MRASPTTQKCEETPQFSHSVKYCIIIGCQCRPKFCCFLLHVTIFKALIWKCLWRSENRQTRTRCSRKGSGADCSTMRRWRIDRIRLTRIPEASAQSIGKAPGDAVDSGAVIRSDGWKGYEGVAALGYAHEVIRATEEVCGDLLPHCHRVAFLIKRWMLGTHHGTTFVFV